MPEPPARPPTRHVFPRFAAVGASGVLVNLATTRAGLLLGLPFAAAYALALLAALLSNFALNRRFTFRYARRHTIAAQFAGFAAACSLGMLVNYLTALSMQWALPAALHAASLPASLYLPEMAALTGIAAGMTFNFLLNYHFVFHPHETPADNPEPTRNAGADATATPETDEPCPQVRTRPLHAETAGASR
jgi:dolichol-phosphate mannosyltransferase